MRLRISPWLWFSAIADLPIHIPQTRSITQIRTYVPANHVPTFCA